MATYTIGGYATSSIAASTGSLGTGTVFSLDAGFEAASQAITFTVTDNDRYFSGSATSQLDAGQTAIVTTAAGSVIASGAVRLGTAATFTTPSGSSAKLYEVYVGTSLIGYVATEQLSPGVALTVSSTAATTSSGQTYAAMVTPSYASSAASSLTGGSGNDTLLAGAGNDTVTANAGHDSVDGGSGDDRIAGGAGDDVLLGGLGLDQLAGGDGNDTLSGGDGIDTLAGEAGNDSLSGGAGNDSLDGGAGDDTLAGGEGADCLNGGSGMDFVDYSANTSAVTVNLTNWTASGGWATGDSLGAIDGVIGTGFSDVITGFDQASYTGADIFTNVLYGGAGNDTIDGRAGNDSLFGGADDDSLIGGAGADTLSGGAGNDTFSFDAQSGADAITDFNLTLVDGKTVDQIDVSGLISASGRPVNWDDAVVGQDASGNAVITFAGVTNGPAITLLGVSPAQISAKQMLHSMGVPCFTAGTLIDTPRGAVPVETLRAGDLVLSRDQGAVPVLWAGGRSLSRAELDAAPELLPVLIRENALGAHGPLLVSPQHAVLALTPAGERLVRARHLAELGDPRFRVAKGKRRVAYHHILLPRHALVRANGLETESLYPGPMALAALGPMARLEIAAAQPWLAPVLFGAADAARVYGPTVRPIAPRRGLHLLETVLECQRVA